MALSLATARTLNGLAKTLASALESTDVANADLAHHATRRNIVEMLDHIDAVNDIVPAIDKAAQAAGAAAAALISPAEPPADADLDIADAADVR